MLNIAALQGRLVSDPELRHTQGGTAVCAFRIAVDRNFTDNSGKRQADFIAVVAWRGTAEIVCKHFRKGQMIALSGRIQTRNYEDKNGNKRTAVEVVADSVNFCGNKNDSGSNQLENHSSPAPETASDESGQWEALESYSDDLPF